MTTFKKLISNFENVKVLIVGDVMLDRYFYGRVNRISPEAPVPVVNVSETVSRVGGAANVAVNVAGLGAKPFLIGLVGNDAEGSELKSVLEKSKVSAEFLTAEKNRPTTVKTRIVAHQQHIVRLDQEISRPVNKSTETSIWKNIEKLLFKIDVVIISDYAKGLLTETVLNCLIEKAAQMKIKIFVDPKGKNYEIYKNSTILTPNKREAAEACNLDENIENLIEKAGAMLMKKLNLKALLITQGEHGMTLFEERQKPRHFPAISRDVFDVTGAGDTVISTLAVAAGAGASLRKAAELANIAAGIVVEHFGTTAVKKEQLIKSI